MFIASVRSMSLLGLYWMITSYHCSRSSILWNLGGVLAMLFWYHAQFLEVWLHCEEPSQNIYSMLVYQVSVSVKLLVAKVGGAIDYNAIVNADHSWKLFHDEINLHLKHILGHLGSNCILLNWYLPLWVLMTSNLLLASVRWAWSKAFGASAFVKTSAPASWRAISSTI